METAIEGTLYRRIIHFFLKRPKVTVVLIMLVVLLFFGVLFYFSTKLNLNHDNSLTSNTNSPKFNLADSAAPSQGAVEGASTQQDDPAEPPASISPSEDIATPQPTATASATLTSTPTPTPTSTPASTSAPTPTVTITPTPTNPPAPVPTATPEVSPTEPPSPSPSQ